MSDQDQTVYIVEDDEAVRDSLSLLLESEGLAVRAYDRASRFLEDWRPDMAGCVVLDIRMPEMDGMELQEALLERGSDLPIIFVTGHGDVPLAVEAMRKGAVDFIEKPYHEEQLLEKIRAALSENAEHRQVREEKQVVLERLAELTPREREIMDRMIAGQANKVIAIELNISQRTVEIHRSRVMHKMGTHSLAQLVRMVLNVQDEA